MVNEPHIKARAVERFGLALDNMQIRQIGKDIRSGNGQFVKKKSNRVSVWDCVVDGVKVRVVYDKKKNRALTVITPSRTKFQKGKPQKVIRKLKKRNVFNTGCG